jgi:predicted nucleic acid-binding protein
VTDVSPITAPLVLDATCLSHFARADRLDVLRDLLVGRSCWTTETVLAELNRGIGDYPLLGNVSSQEWLLVAGLDSVAEIRLYGSWLKRVGSAGRDQGEASVFTTAERHGATAITDDRRAAQVGRFYGLDVHGTIWLLAGACKDGKLTPAGTSTLIDALRATGHRLPCTGAGFPGYARQHGLLQVRSTRSPPGCTAATLVTSAGGAMRRGRSAGARRMWRIAPALAALAFGVAACATPHPASRGSASGGRGAARTVISVTFVEESATSTVTYPEANARLVPLQATFNASGTKLTATEATGQAVALVTADTAYARMNMNLSATTAGDLSGPIVASLYSYYNSAYGQIQPNGTVRLTYRGTPVWVLTAPLVRSINDSQAGPEPNGSPRPAPAPRTGCSYVVIVDARSGSLLTNWQHCPGDILSS